jgi:hypothetical protein
MPGSGVDLLLTARAADFFEQVLGDRARAESLRREQRDAFPDLSFGEIRTEIEIEHAPFLEWLDQRLAHGERTEVWVALPHTFALPTPEVHQQRLHEAEEEAPLLARLTHEFVDPYGVVEIVSGEEALRRHVRLWEYGQLGI